MIGMTFRSRNPTPLALDYPAYFGNRIFIPADNPMTEEGVKLGRMLFYDTRLSGSGKVSCATCHKQERAFSDGRVFSMGADGFPTDRNSMSLVNLLWVKNFFWDGRAAGLEKQSEFPISHPHEMGNSMITASKLLQTDSEYPPLFEQAFGSKKINGALISKALAQFERTLISANSDYDKFLRGNYEPNVSERNGLSLFFTNPDPARMIRGAGCGQCHGGPKVFTELFHNNGLDKEPTDKGRQLITGQEIDKGRFRVVTLRNIALTAPYMHDGRFQTLEKVIDHYNDGVQQSPVLSNFLSNNSNIQGAHNLGLTNREKLDLLAFLNMLTDSDFINDKRFSNPFLKNQ